MENNFKRFLSLLLAFVMVFGMMPANVFAVEDNMCDTCGNSLYVTGWCPVCNTGCDHSVGYENGVCRTCNVACTHVWDFNSCTVCHLTCYDCQSNHNIEGKCETCGNAVGHTFNWYGDNSATCEICGAPNPDVEQPEPPQVVYVAQIGDQGYETLAAAIAAASAGSTITLIGDVTEDVTVNKDLTIDGAGKNYTGNISVTGSTVDIVVKNVNFVNGTGYAITTNSIKSVTVEDCTVKDYGYGFLYANRSTTTINVKDVTVDGGGYGMHWVYGSTATLENVTMTNVTYGIRVQNHAKKTVNLENCTINATYPINIWAKATAVQTINIGQGNNFGGADMDFGAYAKVVGAEVLCDNVIYASYGEAYAAAENGSVLKLVADLDVNAPIVIEKNISLDLNGKTITGLENVYPVVRIQNDANVTVLDSKSDADVAALDSENEGSIVNETDYIFVLGASDGSSKGNLTIENGTFKGATTVASVTKGELIVKGGSFEVVDDATYLLNCIDANYRDGSAKISVQGGTFKGFDPMNNAAEGAGTNFCAVGYESVDNGDGTWTVKKPAYVAQIGEQGYTSLSAAIAAATSGKTIVLLADITEDVSIGKSVTIEGASFNYTGTMNITSGISLTVQNLNVVNGKILKGRNTGTISNLTLKNCHFDGQGLNSYAVEIRNSKNIVIEDCSAKDYGYGFLQLPAANVSLSVKNVEISDVNYGFKVDYSNGVTMENVKVVAREEGIWASNFASKTYTITNSSFTSIEVYERTNASGINTFNFEGANTVGDLENSQYAKYVLVEENATLTAPAGNTVTTTVADLEVIHDGEKYLVADVVYVAEINGVKFETLADAIAAVKNGETIKLLTDIAENVTIKQVANLSFTIDGNNNVYSGTVTIDGNKRYTSAEKLTFQNVKFATEETAHTFVYSGSKDTCQAHNVTFDGCSFTGPEGVNNVMGMYARQSNGITFTNCVAENVMYLFQSNSAGINLTVEDCVIDATYGIRVHNGDNAVIRNVTLNTSMSGIIFDGGQTRTATIENVTITGEGTPIYLNNATAGTQKLVMKGSNNIDGNWFKIEGTGATIGVDLTNDANLDINKVTYDKSYYTVESVEKVHTFTKFTAVAQIGEQGYATLADAIAAAVSGDTITLLADITENVDIGKSVTIDGANLKYTGKMDVTGSVSITLQNLNFVAGCVDKASGHGSVTVMNCNFDGQGLNCYALNLRTGNKNIVIENVTAKGYGYGFLQTPKTCGKISVKNVEITDVNYGFKIDYGTGVTMENVKVDARIEGIWASNYGSKTYTITNSSFSSIEVLERTNASGINTFNFKGANTVDALGASQYAKYVLVEENATLTAPDGNTVTTTVDGLDVIYENGTYKLGIKKNYVAQIGEAKFETLADAIAAATSGQTIVLLADITEDVTVNKSVTIDGAEKTYTGKMNLTSGTITIKNVNFDGKGYNGYAVETRGASSLTVENCSAQNYGYGFVQIVKSCKLAAKDVTVENVNYGFKVDYSNGVTMENVKVVARVEGIWASNYGSKTYTITNSSFSSIEVLERTNASGINTFNFKGANKVDALGASQYAKYVLVEETATLTAPDGNTVTTTVADRKVIYEEGVYKVAPVVYVAEVNGVQYETIQAAVDAAVDGDTITIIKSHELVWDGKTVIDGSMAAMAVVAGKAVTIDLNGMVLTVDGAKMNGTDLYAVFAADEGGSLTMKDSKGTGSVEASGIGFKSGVTAYCLMMAFEPGTMLTVESGTYIMEAAHDSLIYSGANEAVLVTGGNFTLHNVGDGQNGKPWIFNVLGANDNRVTVMGGTYNADVSNQYWIGEVYIPDTHICEDNGDGTWTVHAGNWVAEIQDAEGNRVKAYKTFQEAIDAVVNGQTIVLLTDCAEDVTIAQTAGKSIVVDGNNNNYTGTITVDGKNGYNRAETLTIRNVNFQVDGIAIDTKKGTLVHNITVEGCTFTGDGQNNDYGIYLRNAYNITVKDTSGTGLFDLVYGGSAVTGFTAEDVTVTESYNGIWLSYVNSTADFKKVTTDVENAGVGFYTNASGVATFEGCAINKVINNNTRGSGTMKLVFNDAVNNLAIGGDGQRLTAVLNQVDATLTAIEGLNVIANEELAKTYKVVYENGVYRLSHAIARNEQTGKLYMDLSDGLDEAKENQTVTLLADTSEDLLLVGAYVTLDLNGHVVTAKNALSFGVVMDTASEVGGIKISNKTTEAFTKLQPENGGYLPIYDTNDGMYKFFEYELVNKGAKPNGGAIKFGFAVNFVNEAAYSVLANTEDSGISLTAMVSWTGMTVPTIEYQFTCAQIKEYAANKAAAPTKSYVLFLSIGGLSNLASGDYISAAPVLSTITEVGRTNEAYIHTIA